MSATKNFRLEDLSLSLQTGFYSLFGNTLKERAALQRQLSVRGQHYSADHIALVDVHEGLAGNYFSYSADSLLKADDHAREALRILELNNKKGKASFRAAKLTHLRCQIRQRMNQPTVALELGEDALVLYNKTKLLCNQRSSLMHTLIHLHRRVGSPDRAARLSAEVKVLDGVLTTTSARRRF